MTWTVRKIISGGQTGADRAALDAALAAEIPYGGWTPRGRTDELGAIPARYAALHESDCSDPALRTRLNVRDSDATVIFSRGPLRGGSRWTVECARELGRPWLHLDLARRSEADAVAALHAWIGLHRVQTLNVAGPRASEDPEIYARTRGVLDRAIGGTAS